jgi:hypothetical protein
MYCLIRSGKFSSYFDILFFIKQHFKFQAEYMCGNEQVLGNVALIRSGTLDFFSRAGMDTKSSGDFVLRSH